MNEAEIYRALKEVIFLAEKLDVEIYALDGQFHLKSKNEGGRYASFNTVAEVEAHIKGIMAAGKERNTRQGKAFNWCARAFGDSVAVNKPERGARVLEEATELAQATGVDREMAMKIVDRVYGRPAGEVKQEIGQVGVTLLVLAELYNVSSDLEEKKELARITELYERDTTYFRQRLDKKAAMGIAMPSEPL